MSMDQGGGPVIRNHQLRWGIAFVIVLAGILAYANSLTNDYVWDDASSILRNQTIQDMGNIGQVFHEDQHRYGRGQGNFYRPVLALSFMVDYALSNPAPGQDPGPLIFHITNTIWHIAAALLLYALLIRLGAPRFVQFAVPLIYVVHPLHTQAVTYISGRGDPMAGAFVLLGMWCALREGSIGKRAAGIAAAMACLVAGLLSKESAAVFPFLLLILALGAPTRSESSVARPTLARFIPVAMALLITVVYGILRATVLQFGEDAAMPDAPLGQRIVETGQALAIYLRLMVVPTGLHMERTLDGVPAWVAGMGYGALTVMLVALVWSIRAKKTRIAMGLGWFLVAWFPISGLIPLNAPMAEHWMYLPMAGLLWAVAEAVEPLTRSPRAKPVATGLVYGACLILLVLTVSRNRDWRDNETLFRDTLAHNPNTARVHFNLAVTYEDLEGNIPGAQRHYRRVLEIYEERKAENPELQDLYWDEELEAHLSLGNIALNQGAIDRAARHYQTLLRLQPEGYTQYIMAEAAHGMAQCFLAVGETEQARSMLEMAAQLAPELMPDAPAIQESPIS